MLTEDKFYSNNFNLNNTQELFSFLELYFCTNHQELKRMLSNKFFYNIRFQSEQYGLINNPVKIYYSMIEGYNIDIDESVNYEKYNYIIPIHEFYNDCLTGYFNELNLLSEDKILDNTILYNLIHISNTKESYLTFKINKIVDSIYKNLFELSGIVNHFIQDKIGLFDVDNDFSNKTILNNNQNYCYDDFIDVLIYLFYNQFLEVFLPQVEFYLNEENIIRKKEIGFIQNSYLKFLNKNYCDVILNLNQLNIIYKLEGIKKDYDDKVFPNYENQVYFLKVLEKLGYIDNKRNVIKTRGLQAVVGSFYYCYSVKRYRLLNINYKLKDLINFVNSTLISDSTKLIKNTSNISQPSDDLCDKVLEALYEIRD